MYQTLWATVVTGGSRRLPEDKIAGVVSATRYRVGGCPFQYKLIYLVENLALVRHWPVQSLSRPTGLTPSKSNQASESSKRKSCLIDSVKRRLSRACFRPRPPVRATVTVNSRNCVRPARDVRVHECETESWINFYLPLYTDCKIFRESRIFRN